MPQLQAEQPQSIVPERDESGHGTFLAGVACGSADAGAEFSGAAPLAHIAVVKCKQAKKVSAGLLFYSRWRGMLSGK